MEIIPFSFDLFLRSKTMVWCFDEVVPSMTFAQVPLQRCKLPRPSYSEDPGASGGQGALGPGVCPRDTKKASRDPKLPAHLNHSVDIAKLVQHVLPGILEQMRQEYG